MESGEAGKRVDFQRPLGLSENNSVRQFKYPNHRFNPSHSRIDGSKVLAGTTDRRNGDPRNSKTSSDTISLWQNFMDISGEWGKLMMCIFQEREIE